MKNYLDEAIYQKRTNPKLNELDDPRGIFFHDQTTIIHSLPFRRLKNKTQVFFSPENDHICTRIEHAIHVATVAKTICIGLKNKGWTLDEEMAYTIGLGHDLGHAPFGHAGEDALSEASGKKFYHEIQGYRVVEHIYRLNLTYGVKDGIISHNGEEFKPELRPMKAEKNLNEIINLNTVPSSFEGCIVRFSDKIAYLGRDIEDAIMAGFIIEDNIPDDAKKIFGDENGHVSNASIINKLILDVIESSFDRDCIMFSSDVYKAMVVLKEFNYSEIYKHPKIIEYKKYVKNIIFHLYNYLIGLYSKIGDNYEQYSENGDMATSFGKVIKKNQDFYSLVHASPSDMVVDYISGMTDGFALRCMEEISIPKPIKLIGIKKKD